MGKPQEGKPGGLPRIPLKAFENGFCLEKRFDPAGPASREKGAFFYG
jgi:hypothetical protein